MCFAAFESIFALTEISAGEKKAPITVLSPLIIMLAMVIFHQVLKIPNSEIPQNSVLFKYFFSDIKCFFLT